MISAKSLIGVVALLLAAAAPSNAQTDVIRGRVTNVDGQGVPAVRVTATSIPGSIVRSTITNADGRFQIAFPNGTGDYLLTYAGVGYGARQIEVKRLADEAILLGDARLAPVTVDTLVVNAQRQQRVNRYAPNPDISGTEQQISNASLPPELRGDIASMAASLPGVTLVPGLDGEADGFSVLGLSADQNNTTMNGLPAGTSSLPRDGAYNTSLTTSPYDVSRGGFSGGNFNIRPSSGTNIRMRGMSLVTTTPQLQWADRAAQSLGNTYTNVSLGGLAAGPLSLNKAFYNVSYQLGRQSNDNQTLLNTNALGLQTAGISTDSAARFLDIVRRQSLPLGNLQSSRLSDNGSFLGNFDFAPPGSTSGQAFGLTLTGNWRRTDPVGSAVSQIPSATGQRTNWGGTLQARHSGYLGLVLSETTAGINLAHDFGRPYEILPSGHVRVISDLADNGSGVQMLGFGGNQNLSSFSRNTTADIQNNLSWFDTNNKHRIKLTSELQYNSNLVNQSSNLLGSFVFNSLADFDAGRPALFTRTLSARERTAGLVNGSLALGDSWRRSQDVQFQYGVRVDANHFTTAPAHNSAIEGAFGVRNDNVPSTVSFSPRVGVSWTVGHSNEIQGFTGAVTGPRAVVRAGIGVFSNNFSAGMLGNALDHTGLADASQQIVCVGPAAPTPDWQSYETNVASIPDRCADGSTGGTFSTSAPDVALFGHDYKPQKTVRANASWSGSILDARFSLSVDGTYSRNLNQTRFVDLNFNATSRFSLADDGRPIYAAPTSIVASTGAVSSNDARLNPAFLHVSETRSDLQSRTAQLMVRLSPIPRTPQKFGWNLAYTFANVREETSGFSSTSGDPRDVAWSDGFQSRHQFNYGLSYRLFDAVNISWSGSLRSGMAYTPSIAGDINGDGYANDRAYIPSADADAGMSELLANASSSVRNCLQKQTGTIAGRNSCRGPWTTSAYLNISLDRAKFHIPQRGEISFGLSNPLGAADLLINGSDNRRGWGQTSFPDQSLLYVRGFDAASQRYRYEVNQRFGATRPQFVTLRSPATLTATVRFDLGPTRERQALSQQLAQGRKNTGTQISETMYRMMMQNSLLNPLTVMIRSQDSLRLTAVQADSLVALNKRYTRSVDALWAPVAKYVSNLPKQYDEGSAYDRYINARHGQVDLLIALAPVIRELLTPAQRRQLPGFVTNYLDPRYLAFIRSGTPTFIGGGGGFPMMAGMGDVTFNASSGGGQIVIRR